MHLPWSGVPGIPVQEGCSWESEGLGGVEDARQDGQSPGSRDVGQLGEWGGVCDWQGMVSSNG